MPATVKKGSLKLARTLRDDVLAIGGGREMWWVSVHELALRHPDESEEAIDAAVALAIDKGWLHATPGPGPALCVSYKHKGSFGA